MIAYAFCLPHKENVWVHRLQQGPYGKLILFPITLPQIFWMCSLRVLQRDWRAIVFYLRIFMFQIFSFCFGEILIHHLCKSSLLFQHKKNHFLYKSVLDQLPFWINKKKKSLRKNIRKREMKGKHTAKLFSRVLE